MYTEDLGIRWFVINLCSKWHVLEHVVDLLEDTVGIVNVLIESVGAFLSESKISVHVAVFMVAA